MNKLLGRFWFWLPVFVMLFALSFRFDLNSATNRLTLFGWPTWLNYFLVLQIALILALIGFARFGWNTRPR